MGPVTTPTLIYRLSSTGIGLGLVSLAAIVALTASSLSLLADYWFNKPEYSHAPIIPLVAAFLVWQQKDELERLPFRGSWIGVAVALFGASLAMVDTLGSVFSISIYGAVLALYGVVLAGTGAKVFRKLGPPLLILLLMVPLPSFLLNDLSAKMQLVSSQLGVALMRLVGVSVYLEGNVIDLGDYQLEVAEACDGLRYLFPMMTLGFIMAYFFKVALWKRVVLFLSSIPITILMNGLRVGMIGIMVEHWGITMAEGFLHEFQGWAVFMLSAALMLLEMIFLARIGSDGRPWREVFGLEFPAPTPKDAHVVPRKVQPSQIAACVVLLLMAGISLALPERTQVVPQRQALVEFPMTLGEWEGRRSALEGIYLEKLELDDYLLADFRTRSAAPVNLYVAWYDSQQTGRSVHSPRACLPGGGWQIKEFDEVEVPGVAVEGVGLRVNRALIAMGPNRQLVYYWFQQRGRVITNEYRVKWYLFWDSLMRDRSDGALVRLVVPLEEGQDIAEADRQLAEFARETAPLLRNYIPR